MPRPPETPDVRASKALAYILRHGAEKEGLHIRSDGYIRLDDVLARPKMRDVDKNMVLRLVEDNAKKRFELAYGYDPSPPVPKKGKGQNKGKSNNQSGKNQPQPTLRASDNKAESVETTGSLDIRPDPESTEPSPAIADTLPSLLASTQITSTELPLVILPIPTAEDTSPLDERGGYYIRASQGHSINLEGVAHLEPVLDDEEGRKRAGLMVHGTKWELWDVLREQGLSKMARQHIHFAPALSLSEHPITPRPTSTLLIYLDLGKAAAAGIPVYTSANGVVLSPGDERGVVRKELWKLAERVQGGLQGTRTVVWRDGEEAVAEDKAAPRAGAT